MKSNRSLKSGILSEVFPLGEERHTVLNEIDSRARTQFPFYFMLPYDDPIALLRWRIYARERAIEDLEFRDAIWEMGRVDAAFFFVTFLTIFEPRPRPRGLPFFLWTDQVSMLAWYEECYGVRPMGANKTRGMGWSWLTSGGKFHKWCHDDECQIAVITEDETKLDSPDSNSCLGKLQYMFDHLPAWAKYTRSGASKLKRTKDSHTFVNIDNADSIQGFVSRAQKLRQLRFTQIEADEFAYYDRVDQDEWVVAAGGCTNNLVLGSTWNDFGDMFHPIMFEEESNLLKVHFFWWNSYERWQGAYKMVDGNVVYVDKDYKHKPNYKFGEPDVIEEGMLRSPWVDAELSQPGKRRNIMKALRDLYGMEVCQQTNSFFDSNTQSAVKETISEPDVQGVLDVSHDKVEILPTLKSDIRIWGELPDIDRGPFTIFCDLGQGVQAAFSVACALDRFGNQCLEYGTNTTGITQFAHNVVMIARWLGDANGDNWVLIDFESNGVPKPFYTELTRMSYGNIHASELKSPRHKQLVEGEIPSYYGTRNGDGGKTNFNELERAIMAIETRVTSERVANDMRRTGKDNDKNGQPKFSASHKDGHGDFIQAYAGAWWRARSSVSRESMVELEKATRHGENHQPWDTDTNEHWSESWNN